MTKRILSLLLLLGTVLSLIPTVGVAAEEVLPKDETPGAISAATPEGSHSFTDYDALYVGADGRKTANGGKLIGLYTAYAGDATVDIVGGKWKNKMDATGATDAILRDESPVAAFAVEANGFGYHLTKAQIRNETDTGYIKDYQKIGVTFPEAWAMMDSFTVEQAARFDAIESERTLSALYAAVRIDLLHGFWLPAAKDMASGEAYCMRWRIAKSLDYGANFAGTGKFETAYRDAYSLANKPAGMVTAYTKTMDARTGAVTYGISYNTGIVFPAERGYSVTEIEAMRADAAFSEPAFSLFNGMSGTFYAVRVYDAPLTEAEKAHNAAVDMIAYTGVDPTKLLVLETAYRDMLLSGLALGIFPDDKAYIEEKIDEMLAFIEDQPDLSETLYVTEGLTFFASAYQSFATDYSEGETVEWKNILNPAESASLRGGFYRNKEGGFTIVKSNEEYNQSRQFGIYMPGSALPEKDYTVEMVYNPFGISVKNEDGTLERYLDATSKNGDRHHARGIAIGPLCALQFSSYRPAGFGAQMDRRWFYAADKDYYGVDCKQDWTETSWGKLELYEAVNYVITHDYSSGGSVYNFYHNTSHLYTYNIASDKYISAEEAGNRFHLLLGLPGTAYALRVYDRPLSAAEIAQNKVADVVYYHDLDASKVIALAEVMGDEAGVLYQALSSISFLGSREAAQAELDRMLIGVWVTFSGAGVRKGSDGEGVRYYFDCTLSSLTAMARAGYSVEIGALVNVDKELLPDLNGDNYDYKITTYDSVAGRNKAFFVDEDTFAVTVKYDNLDRAAGLAKVFVRGYIKLTAADGSETVYYVNASDTGSGYESLFHVYESLSDAPKVQEDGVTKTRIKAALERCYERITVYVDAAAASGGIGSKDAPFRSFGEGFAKCKELLAKVNAPTRYILLLKDGEYGIYETQELSAEEMPYAYATLEILSDGGETTLTTTKEIEADFTRYANNVWVTQLDKEADGSYPCFRYLYVDGKIADLAYNGGRYAADLNRMISGFERDYDAPWGRAYEMYKKQTLTKDSVSGYPASRPDLNLAFEEYKTGFLALMEMEKIYARKELLPDTQCTDSADPLYVQQFEAFKLRRLILDEMTERYRLLIGTDAERKSVFSTFEAQKYTDNSAYETYKAAFKELRLEITSYEGIVFSEFQPMVETTAIENGKYYLNIDAIGDLREAVAAGRKRNEARYEEILAAYRAADATGKVALEEKLAEAEEWIGDRWFRYALQDAAPEMHQAGQWWHNIVHIQGVDYEDTVIDENGDTHVAVYLVLEEYKNFFVHGHYKMKGRYVYVKNALDYVDSEGEYYYDEPTGKLYYYSASSVSDKRFERPTGDYMFIFNDVSGITFHDLRITGVDDAYLSHNDGCVGLGTRGATGEWINDPTLKAIGAFTRSAILLNDSRGFTAMDCVFEELGTRAIMGVGKLAHIRVENNEFGNLGANAVHLGDGTRERTWSEGENWIEDVTIVDNYIHDVGREYYNAAGIWINYGKDLSVLRNTVERCSYTAIGIGFTYGLSKFDPSEEAYHMYRVEVAYNYVTDFMRELGDGAGIYLSGGNATATYTGYFNNVHDNYILMSNATGNGLGHMLVGIYFDGAATNWYCYRNVITEQSYGAAEGENDDLYLSGDPYTVAMRNRRLECYYIYLQHIMSQETYNILCDWNYILNVRATDAAKQKLEVYREYVVEDRSLYERNTQYIVGVDRIPTAAEDIIYAAGVLGHQGDPSVLWDNDY
ncbi:MAG: right-handed parallel beta-helix repeat-containing protein [Clostridia bacterium]|nr:right-handed parallel beta-helix repeat-containing protein [Clostridia bacterium]